MQNLFSGSILSDDLRKLDEFNQTITKLFFWRCFETSSPEPARKLWTSPHIKYSTTNNSLLYYDLLYNCGKYEEVLKEFQENYERLKSSQSCLMLGRHKAKNCFAGIKDIIFFSVSFCCYKLGTREALETCLSKIIPIISLEHRGKSKIEMATALMAYNLGEFAVGE